MILGIDVSIEVCKAEGYTMIEYDARKKFNADTEYRIFNTYPEWHENHGEVMTENYLSFNDLKESYLEDKKGIDSFAETNIHVNFENPNYYDFLNLASDLLQYKGL